MNLIETLKQGLEQVGFEYVNHPEFTIDDYRGMTIQYLMSALLIQLGESGNCGLYSHPKEVGYIGWIDIGECSLFFAPTAVVKLCGDERGRLEDSDLSPIGNL